MGMAELIIGNILIGGQFFFKLIGDMIVDASEKSDINTTLDLNSTIDANASMVVSVLNQLSSLV